MKFTSIYSTNEPFFKNAWELYHTAFPIDERRDIENQEKILKHVDYQFEIIFFDNEFIGFIAWWQFSGLRFIEHFATQDKHRGKGYGKTILEQFILENKELTIFEVEHPISAIDQRRIGFYERLSFKVNTFKYQQLPLRKNGRKVDLLIMSHPSIIDKVILTKFEKEFKEKCFDPYIEG